MRLASADLYRYALPLSPPLEGPDGGTRRGVLLRLETDDGAVGWGDAAPLPGFSAESTPEAADQLQALARSLPGSTVAVSRRRSSLAKALKQVWTGRGGAARWAPSVRFAVEGAIAEAAASASGRPTPALLGPQPRPAVSVNDLVAAADEDAEAAAERIREDGYRAVKVKVGRGDPTYEAAGVRVLADRLGPGVSLRLDANRAWRLEEATAFADELRAVPVEYVEEPLAEPSPDRLRDFERQTGLPVALDETTREVRPGRLSVYRFARALVLKPTLIGGLRPALRFAAAADRFGMTPVVSAAFESGVGHRLLAALAATLGRADVPAGLGTYRRLQTDVLSPRPALAGPTIDVEALFDLRAAAVDASGLELL
jgi:O-succinylbenzoate synthase